MATHSRLHKLGTRSTVQDHLPPEAAAYMMRDPQWCLAQAEKVGERCLELIENLFAHQVLDNLRAVQGILRLKDRYGTRWLEAACARALDYEAGTYRNVKNILERGLDQQRMDVSIVLPVTYTGIYRFTRPTKRT